MLAVPCGLPSYMGAWPPCLAGATMIEPLAELAAVSAHSARVAGGATYPHRRTREEHADYLQAVAERDRLRGLQP